MLTKTQTPYYFAIETLLNQKDTDIKNGHEEVRYDSYTVSFPFLGFCGRPIESIKDVLTKGGEETVRHLSEEAQIIDHSKLIILCTYIKSLVHFLFYLTYILLLSCSLLVVLCHDFASKICIYLPSCLLSCEMRFPLSFTIQAFSCYLITCQLHLPPIN